MKIKYLLVLVTAGLIAGITFGWWYWQSQKNSDRWVADRVARLIQLPEEPAKIARVTDKTKLEPVPFFKAAENGDVVLIFEQSGRAIIYRPKIDKLIEAGNIVISNQ